MFEFKKFPKDIRELINLRHWENDGYMPCGIGELTLLQSLPVFVVGGVGRLSELKGLNNLKGELRIEKLENVRDVVVESREANLREKKYIRFLGLQWRNLLAQSNEDAETLMEGLHPPPSLEKLRIRGYGGMRFPSWMSNGGLSHLKSLLLLDLENVEYVGCSSEGPFFPFLEKLEIYQMPALKELWRDLPTHPPPSCPCLSHLLIHNCDGLASLELHSSPLLSHLDIQSCRELTSLELHSSPLLSKLRISVCRKLTSLLLPLSPVLSSLEISSCYKLTSLLLPLSPVLSSLKISSCHKLTSLLLPLSPSLSSLDIWDCPDLASLELHSYPLLSSLSIAHCGLLTSLLVPPSRLLSQ